MSYYYRDCVFKELTLVSGNQCDYFQKARQSIYKWDGITQLTSPTSATCIDSSKNIRKCKSNLQKHQQKQKCLQSTNFHFVLFLDSLKDNHLYILFTTLVANISFLGETKEGRLQFIIITSSFI